MHIGHHQAEHFCYQQERAAIPCCLILIHRLYPATYTRSGEVMTETQASIYEKEKARRGYGLYQKADCTMEGVSYCEDRHCY